MTESPSTDRFALVTGGNRGIGLAICKALFALSYQVILCARKEDEGKAAAREIDPAQSGRVKVEVLDLSDSQSITGLLERLNNQGIEVDVLINNAAIYPSGSIIDVSPDVISEAWQINVLGPWLLIQGLVPGMLQRGFGRVVNVSSGGGSLKGGGYPGHSAYGVTKSALNSLTVNLAPRLSGDVKVNSMCPGWVRTRMGGSAAPRSPEEGAETAVWLATLDEAGPNGGFFRDKEAIDW